jgi:hypothetical protein
MRAEEDSTGQGAVAIAATFIAYACSAFGRRRQSPTTPVTICGQDRFLGALLLIR